MDGKQSFCPNEKEIKALIQRVEDTANMKATTPKEFEKLSEAIFRRTGILLSPTTLKRIWGYLNESKTARRSTLDTLARFCGWRDYDHFLSGATLDIESGNVGSKVIRAGENIRPGERVRLFWNPGRVCEIKYLGNLLWIVMEAEGTRLQPGDRFRCPLIISGEPLYLDNLTKDGSRPGVYICGARSGITFEIIK